MTDLSILTHLSFSILTHLTNLFASPETKHGGRARVCLTDRPTLKLTKQGIRKLCAVSCLCLPRDTSPSLPPQPTFPMFAVKKYSNPMRHHHLRATRHSSFSIGLTGRWIAATRALKARHCVTTWIQMCTTTRSHGKRLSASCSSAGLPCRKIATVTAYNARFAPR